MLKSDTCGACDEFQHKVQAAETNNWKSALEIDRIKHFQVADKFWQLKRLYEGKARKNKLTLLNFDFMQNIVVPNLQTNMFFLFHTALGVCIVVHNVDTKQATMNVYDEVCGRKGANNVSSLLFRYLARLPKRPLALMCDNCPGQIKNKMLIRFLYAVVYIWRIVPKITSNERSFVLI